MKTILLKFAGPLQSWGSSSHFESRHTDPHPSKSAVIGMIAAAFGYRRDCTDKITALNKLHFAVRADQVGDIKEDYQTAHKYKFNPDKTLERTYVTHRYYLEDAVFVAAVGHEDDVWMDRIVQALRHPYFQLYMGRRSYPIPADCILGTVQTDVLSALQQEPGTGDVIPDNWISMQTPIFCSKAVLLTEKIILCRCLCRKDVNINCGKSAA